MTDEQKFEKAISTFKIDKSSKIYDLVKKHKTFFMADAWDIRCTTLMKHKIVTEGEPVLIKPTRQPMNIESKMDEAITNL